MLDRAVVLAWHVDYWDYLGWKDPYGSAAATQRQTRYAKARAQKQKWTPQFVVGNEVLRERMRETLDDGLAKAAETPAPLAIEADLRWRPAGEGAMPLPAVVEGTLRVKRLAPEAATPGTLEVLPLLVLRRTTTACPAGENAGKTLVEYQTVAAVGTAATLDAALTPDGHRFELTVPLGTEPANLGVAVLVEDREKMRTVECRWFSIPAAGPPAAPPESR